MASTNLYTKRRSPPNVVAPSVSSSQTRSKSTGGFFCKFVLFVMFLLALPLFPSQAPDFVAETVLTKFWELIHLLFVGIAVAYGLFSRRNVESTVDLRMSRVDESSLSYVSRIFQVSSVFDEEFENSCEFDVESESHSINGSARASVMVKERKSDSSVVENELEESSEYGKINQVQAWNSQYFQGRSKVVVARPAYGLGGHVVHQTLGLPVRSLRSALRENATPEEDNSFSDSCDGIVNGKAESLADEILDEVLATPSSPVPWHSRPEMMGIGDNYPTNFQPLSMDENQYAPLKSMSSRSTGSSSSSHTQNRFSPSRSVSEESLNSNVEESVKEKSVQDSSRSSSPSLPPSPSLSQSPPSPELITDDTHRNILHSRHYSDGSSLEEDTRHGFENELEGRKVRGRRTEFFSKNEPGSKSLKLTSESSRRRTKSRRSYPPDPKRSHDSLELTAEDEKLAGSFPAQPTNAKASMQSSRERRDVTRNSEDDSMDSDKSRKSDIPCNKSDSLRSEPQSWRASSKGKSVRTIRSDRHGKDGDSSDDKSDSHGRTKPRKQWKKELSIIPHQENLPETKTKPEVEDEIEREEPQISLEEEEEAVWESQSNASRDHNEVDRKADEFIAKFREQIRLQKLTSGEQSRGGGGGGVGIIRNRNFR